MRSIFGRLAAVALAATFLISLASFASAKEVKPEKDTVYANMMDGLKLIKSGKFDAWIEKFCHKERLCYNGNSISSLKRYNLPAMKRLLDKPGDDSCIKPGDKLDVKRVDGDPDKDDKLKIFLQCHSKGMPRPFHMAKEGKTWKFVKI